jgi:hypothetical protein
MQFSEGEAKEELDKIEKILGYRVTEDGCVFSLCVPIL